MSVTYLRIIVDSFQRPWWRYRLANPNIEWEDLLSLWRMLILQNVSLQNTSEISEKTSASNCYRCFEFLCWVVEQAVVGIGGGKQSGDPRDAKVLVYYNICDKIKAKVKNTSFCSKLRYEFSIQSTRQLIVTIYVRELMIKWSTVWDESQVLWIRGLSAEEWIVIEHLQTVQRDLNILRAYYTFEPFTENKQLSIWRFYLNRLFNAFKYAFWMAGRHKTSLI